jgi:hypothetical protein
MRAAPLSGVVSEAWKLYGRHWRHLIPVAAAVYVSVAIITFVLSLVLGGFGAFVGAVLSIVGLFWVQGALTRAVQDIRDGRADLSVADTFAAAQSTIGPIALASILAGLGIAIGFLLLIVPGLILVTIWSLIVPVIVLERAPALASFGRSRALVRGHGWEVFGVVVVTFLILIAFGIVLGIVFAPLHDSVAASLSNVVSGALTAPFVALTWTLVYYRLSEGAAAPTS